MEQCQILAGVEAADTPGNLTHAGRTLKGCKIHPLVNAFCDPFRVATFCGLTEGIGLRSQPPANIYQPFRLTGLCSQNETCSRDVNLNARAVARVSKPAVSPASKSAGRGDGAAVADLEIRDTADLEVCATALKTFRLRKCSGLLESERSGKDLCK